MSTGAAALLAGLVDYAGLFPPAGLSMDEAVAEYARWRRAPEAFMLGRFVVPAARLEELARAARQPLAAAGTGDAWRVSALVGPDLASDLTLVADFNARHAGRAVVDSVELKAAGPEQAEQALAAVPPGIAAYVELATGDALGPALAVLKRRGARAKIRTGGVVPEAIPAPAAVARFIAACAAAGVPFKATAGLHHALRGEQALTYDPGSPRAVMHGFLNLFAAAAFAHAGADAPALEAVLCEQAAAAFRFDDDGLAWGPLRAKAADVAAARSFLATSFGSCSFAEPVADLHALGLIASEIQPTGTGGTR